MKNIKTKLLIVSILTLVGIFALGNIVSAQIVVPSYDSATITGTVITGTPPTHARFSYATSYSTVANGQGTTTPVQYFYTEGTFPIQQYISGLTENTTYYYRLEVTNNYGTQNLNIESFKTSLRPVVIQNPTVTIYATPDSISYGGNSTISWYSNNATSCYATGGTNRWTGDKNLTGSFSTEALYSSTTYNISCTNASGSMTDSVTVNVIPQTQNPTATLTITPTYIQSGESSQLSWDSTNASYCVGTGFNTYNQTTGLTTVYPTSTTTYGITCYGTNGTSDYDSKTVVVQANQTMSGTLTPSVSSCVISPDNSFCTINFSWNTINPLGVSSVTKPVNTIVGTGNSGYGVPFNVKYNGETFYLYNSGTLLAQSSVTSSCVSGTSWDGYKCTQITVIYPPTVDLTADNTNLNYEGSTYIRWTSSHAVSCNASGGSSGWSGSKTTAGNFYTGALTNTTTYNITCQGEGGSVSDSIIVNVGGGGQNNIVTVNTSSANNIGSNYATLNGYVSSNGNTNVNAWFEWGTSSYYGNQTSQINYGTTSGTSYSYYISGLSQNTTYYYRAVAQSNNGQLVYGNQMAFTTTNTYNPGCTSYNCYSNQPLVTTYSATGVNNTNATLNGYIDPNGSYVTRWFEYSVNSTYLYSSTSKTNQSTYPGNFSDTIYNLSPNTIYYYRAAAQGSNGNVVYGNVLTFVTNSGISYNSCINGICTPTAVTSMATSIGQSNARLNGIALVNNAVYTSGYFEYGTTQALGRVTTNKSIGSTQSNPFYENLYGLASDTTYYYRAVVTNQYGTSRGDIANFRTLSQNTNTNTNTNTTTRIIYRDTKVVTNTNDTTGNSKPSLVFLTISRNNETIRQGSVIEYVVSYKNVSSKNLKNIVLQVFIPKGLEFKEASRGTFSPENTTLVANIGDLKPQEEGSTRITVKVNGDVETNKIIVVTANLAYTVTDTNTQEEVFAYSTNTIEDVVVSQGAAAFLFGTGFLPNNLIGWLLLILLVVLLVLAARKAYYGPAIIPATDTSKKGH